ncbi:MAG TPA: hypothetical protein VFA70_12645, partial [Dehalococcoidia bacterium]|nr:hypothetical protein [Dehalococcoidia bacterium]
MSRKPDAVVMQAAVLALFHAVTPAFVRPRITRPAAARPGTIVAFTHATDLDVPVAVSSMIPLWRGPRWIGRTTFAGKSDLFLPGFLALAFPQLGPLRRPLFGVELRPVLRSLRVVPVSKSGPRLVAEWLYELQGVYGGAAPAAPLLSDAWQAELRAAGVPADATLAQLHAWPYHRLLAREAGAELLSPGAARRLRLHEAHAARDTLEELARPLREGALLFMAPEGELSPDG